MITIINYGLGNIQAFVNVYKRLHIPVSVATCADELKSAKRLILPGVGAFDHAMQLFNQSGMRETVEVKVLQEKKPILGICVGMQILANSSEEGVDQGLGWIPGKVKHFHSNLLNDVKVPLPHMGWNDVKPVTSENNETLEKNRLFLGLESDARFYFLHSFYFECTHSENVAATASYGKNFSCAVANQNIYGVQFHPEKSHSYGTTLLKNFAEI